MRAGHLDDQGALDLIPGLGALDEAKRAFTAISQIPLFGSRGLRA
jgi:hypothetical protein